MIVAALGLAVVLLLGLKVVATVILLSRDRTRWFQTRSGAFLWWSSKITPLLAVPCMIAIANLQHRFADAWIYWGLMGFVALAVPMAVWSRFYRR
ncbi:MAG: hypothetical protein ABW023_12970 [Sphingomonas sp.]